MIDVNHIICPEQALCVLTAHILHFDKIIVNLIVGCRELLTKIALPKLYLITNWLRVG